MHVCFVCSGNICRSPMAALVFEEFLRRERLTGVVRVTSAGTGGWHVGSGADHRAAQTLAENGYPNNHVAAILGKDHLNADLLLALDSGHYRALQKHLVFSGDDLGRIRMLRSFDPAASGDLDVPDPYYGGNGGFTNVLGMIEASMPGLMVWVRENLDR